MFSLIWHTDERDTNLNSCNESSLEVTMKNSKLVMFKALDSKLLLQFHFYMTIAVSDELINDHEYGMVSRKTIIRDSH